MPFLHRTQIAISFFFLLIVGVWELQAQSTLIPLTTRRDMVFDYSGNFLYITTSNGFVRPYNLSTGQLETGYNLGGSLNGMDIARDDSFLLIAQNNVAISQGTFHKLNLGTGASTNIDYVRASGESGAWDVGIGSNGLALVTTQYDGSGWVPLRQINLANDAITVRTDTPGSGPFGNVNQNTQIHHSADGTRFYFLESTSSGGPIFTYSAITNSFGPKALSGVYWGAASAAVNRNGMLLATKVGNISLDTAPNFTFIHTFNGMDSGVAFDPLSDTLYAVSSVTRQIVAYDTGTLVEKFRLDIGETINAGVTQFGSGNLIASHDGRYLALGTPSGIRLFALPVTIPSPSPTPTPSLGTPRDMVFDHSGEHLYITTNEGFVFPYNVGTETLESPYYLGGSLRGIDIAADDSFLTVAQYNMGLTQGAFHKLDLKTGAMTNFNYTRAFGEGGGWDVAIGSNGRALITTEYNGSGWTPLREINLVTNSVTVRDDAPGSSQSLVRQETQIHRSADRTRFYFSESNSSSGPIFTYDATSNTFGPKAVMGLYSPLLSIAVNRDGSLLATRMIGTALDTAPAFNFVHSLGQPDSGVAFDSLTDMLYAVKSSTSEIIAYDTGTFTERYRLPIGATLPVGTTQFGSGTLVASPDGRYLALRTPSEIRLIPIPNPLPSPTPIPTPALGRSRDMVFDHSGQRLYITTDEGLVFPYNISSERLENPYDLGGTLRGIDIAPDDSFLLVAQYYTGVTQGTFQKVDLHTGTITNINYPRGSEISGGGWDVAVSPNGLAFVTTGSSNFSPVRQIDLTTNVISIRADTPVGVLSSPIHIRRNGDGTRLFFFGEGSIPGSLFSYDASSNSFGPRTQIDSFGSSGVTVSRDGQLLGLRAYPNIYVSVGTMPNYSFVHRFDGLDGGYAFDSGRDDFYGVNSSTDQIIAYDTNNFAETFRFDIGENVGPGSYEFGPGLIVTSPNDRYLALQTSTAIRVYNIPAVQLLNVVSAKDHGAGTFAIDLPLDGPQRIECRSGGVTGDYTMIFTFGLSLASVGGASVTSGDGTVVSSAIDGTDNRRYVVNLTGVTNRQYIKVTLNDVNDTSGNHTESISQQMGVLLGDIDGNGSVNASDIGQTKARSGQTVTAANFRTDVNVSGSISAADISLVKSKAGTGLP